MVGILRIKILVQTSRAIGSLGRHCNIFILRTGICTLDVDSKESAAVGNHVVLVSQM